MNAIQQIVQIPMDRRLKLDLTLPDDIPIGRAEMLVVISPVPKQAQAKRLGGMRGLCTMDKNLDIKAFEREEVIAMFEGWE